MRRGCCTCKKVELLTPLRTLTEVNKYSIFWRLLVACGRRLFHFISYNMLGFLEIEYSACSFYEWLMCLFMHNIYFYLFTLWYRCWAFAVLFRVCNLCVCVVWGMLWNLNIISHSELTIRFVCGFLKQKICCQRKSKIYCIIVLCCSLDIWVNI